VAAQRGMGARRGMGALGPALAVSIPPPVIRLCKCPRAAGSGGEQVEINKCRCKWPSFAAKVTSWRRALGAALADAGCCSAGPWEEEAARGAPGCSGGRRKVRAEAERDVLDLRLQVRI